MRATVNIKPLVSAIALSGVILATAVALNNAQVSSTQSKDEARVTTSGAFDAELARCKAIGAEAANDPVCKAVWEDNRKRFFESGKPDKPIGSFSVAPNWRPSLRPAQAPKDTSPATPNPSPLSGDSSRARAK